MVECFVVLAPQASPEDVHTWLAAAGGRSIQAYGERALIVELPEVVDAEAPETSETVTLYGDRVPEDLPGLDEVGRMGAAAWNLRHSEAFQESRRTRVGEGRSWDDEGVEPEG
jgi:hypothetical protein